MGSRISVIIPVYNQKENLLLRSVNSALNQDYPDIECILVDDGSTNGIGQVCDNLAEQDSRITVLRQKNKRQGAARNNGVAHSTGRYIFFLDSDDWIEPNTFRHLADLIEKYHAQISVCGCFKQTADGVVLKSFFEEKITVLNRYQAFESYVFNTEYCDHSPCNKLYDRSLFEGEQFVENSYYEDLASIYKFVQHADTIVHTNMPLYCYYDNLTSTMHKPFSEHEFDKVKIYNDISNYFMEAQTSNEYRAFIRELDRQTVYCSIGYVCNYFSHTKTEATKKCLKKTRQICKTIHRPIGARLSLLRKLIVINPYLFSKGWKIYLKLSKGEPV